MSNKAYFFLSGFISLLEEIAYVRASKDHGQLTPSAILGPWFRPGVPLRPLGANIVLNVPEDGEIAHLSGRVLNVHTGEPIPNAVIDVWQASTNGLYDLQDEQQVDFNLRGKFQTDSEGKYWFYCLRPTPYMISMDTDVSAIGLCAFPRSVSWIC
jgi:catechol 1,2-dioxygenase